MSGLTTQHHLITERLRVGHRPGPRYGRTPAIRGHQPLRTSPGPDAVHRRVFHRPDAAERAPFPYAGGGGGGAVLQLPGRAGGRARIFPKVFLSGVSRVRCV